jgi:hypothetical protein
MRFAGELSTFLAVFSGLGFVHIADRVDLARPPVPFREPAPVRGDGGDSEPAFELPTPRGAVSLLFLFLLIAGLGVTQAPVKANQVLVPEHKYETATWIDEYAAENDIETDYVFTEWSRNRMYNYFVSGESQSYGFARSNYDAFLRSTQPEAWYERLRGQVGFIVFNRHESGDATLHGRLTQGLGTRYKGYGGSGHYRAIRITDRQQVHQLVPGRTSPVRSVTGRHRRGTRPSGSGPTSPSRVSAASSVTSVTSGPTRTVGIGSGWPTPESTKSSTPPAPPRPTSRCRSRRLRPASASAREHFAPVRTLPPTAGPGYDLTRSAPRR